MLNSDLQEIADELGMTEEELTGMKKKKPVKKAVKKEAPKKAKKEEEPKKKK